MRLLAGLLVLSAGCFDFDHLSRNYGRDLGADLATGDDLSMPDLATGDDLASSDDLATADLHGGDFASPDLLTADFSPAFPAVNDLATPPSTDLAGECSVSPSPAPQIWYVDPNAPGPGMGDRLSPYRTLDDVAANAALADDAAILVARGAAATSAMFTKRVNIYGGWYADFTCRDSSPAATQLTASGPNLGAVRANGTRVTLDGITVSGDAPASASDKSVAIQAVASTLILDRVQAFSHSGAGLGSAFALEASGSSVRIHDSFLEARPSSGGRATAISSCSSLLDVRGSVLRALGNSAGVVRASSSCGSPTGPQIQILRSLVEAAGWSGTTGLELTWGGFTASNRGLDLQRDVIVARGSGSRGLASTTTSTDLDLRGSTVVAPLCLDLGGSSTEHSILEVRDNILACDRVLQMTADQSSASAWEKNIITATNDPIIDFGTGTAYTRNQLMVSPSPFGTPLFVDPHFLADGYHLSSTSIDAIDHALTCWGTENSTVPKDFEGQHNDLSCDIGGDEYVP